MPRRLPFLLVFLVLLVPFWQPLSMLFRMAIESDRYTYIVFVPFISLCVFYFERKAILSNRPLCAEKRNPIACIWLDSILASKAAPIVDGCRRVCSA